MKNEKKNKRNRFSRHAKTGAAFIIIICMVFPGCVSRPLVGSWDNASLVAEQRIIIERQQQYIDSMGWLIQSGATNLQAAIEELGKLNELHEDFGEWLWRVDRFVRAVIAEQQRLERLQLPNSAENAGER